MKKNTDYNSYIDNKNKELELFEYSPINLNGNEIKNIKKIMQAKLKRQGLIKSRFIKKNYNYRNTSKNIQKLVFGDFSCSYEYQRYDMNIQCKDFLLRFYNRNTKEYKHIFTNCGMSAITSLFYALHKLSYNIDFISNIYVETERVLDDYIKNKDTNKNKVLFLDSVSFKPLSELIKSVKKNEYDMFIFDTSLYLNDEVNNIIDQLTEFNKPIILVKSHTKLDMLGTEWSKLGSICFINDEDEMIEKLYKEVKIILSFNGGFAYLEDIPLFFLNKNFQKVVNNRGNRIKENSKYVYSKLKNKKLNANIFLPYHNLFIIIAPDRFIEYKQLEKDLHNFAENSKYKDLICYADSFGLDYFGINGYYLSMTAETEVIRISPSDFPKEIVDEIVEELSIWLESYLK